MEGGGWLKTSEYRHMGWRGYKIAQKAVNMIFERSRMDIKFELLSRKKKTINSMKFPYF